MVTLDDCLREHQKLFIYSENMDKMKKILNEENFFTKEEKEIVHNHSSSLNKLIGMIEVSMKEVDVGNSFHIKRIYNYELKILENAKKFERIYMEVLTKIGYAIKIRNNFIEDIKKVKY